MVSSKVRELKEKGNQCMKDGKHAEAVFYYTHAIKLDPKNYQLYSNRSLAFHKIQQHYYSREDATQCIKLNPNWAKAYYRKGEVEYECGFYEEAIESFKKAYQLQSEDKNILEAIKKAKKEDFETKKANVQIPWVGAGFGFVIGVFLVVADHVMIEKSFLGNPILKLLVILTLSAIGYGCAKINRYYTVQNKRSLLEPPVDLFGETTSGNFDEDVQRQPAAESNGTANKQSKKDS